MGLVLATGCFNPDDPSADTDVAATTGSSSGETSMSGPTTTPGSSSGGTTVDPTEADTGSSSSSSTGGTDVPDWGEGEPPDFGDLGDEGDGAILVVHALEVPEAVDVWLVGDTEPLETDLSPGDAVRLTGIPRDARRVVLATAGTTDAVACSEWFPLRADEQWATVAVAAEHTCTGGDGLTPTFEQDQALSGNAVRFVHGATPDVLTVQRGGTPEPGDMDFGETLVGTDLPDCETSGCSVRYTVGSSAVGQAHDFTFATQQVADVPPPGEVLFVVAGDVRQDWPGEDDAMALLAVTIEGGTRPMRRDPEVAFIAPETTADVTFAIPTPPSQMQVGTVAACFQGDNCVAPTRQFSPGMQTIFANGPQGNGSGDFDLQGGERYVLVYLPTTGDLVLQADEFSREDEGTSVGRLLNWTGDLLTLGLVFNGMGQAIPEFTDIAAGSVSDEGEVPDGSWDPVWSSGGAPVTRGCFSFAQTPAPWRGFFWRQGMLELDQWPPIVSPLGLICS